MARYPFPCAVSVLVLAAALPGQVRPATHAVPKDSSTASVEVFVEPTTRIAFPLSLAHGAKQDLQHLGGVAVHTRTLFNVKSFVVGLYVDGPGAARHLEAWKGKSSSKIQRDRKFYEALVHGDFDKTLRFVMADDSPEGEFAADMEDYLVESIRLASREVEDPNSADALEVFLLALRTRSFDVGAELMFIWRKGGNLTMVFQGKPEPALQSPALCLALFDLHLGQHSLPRKSRKNLVARFPAILAADYGAAPSSKALDGALESLDSGG